MAWNPIPQFDSASMQVSPREISSRENRVGGAGSSVFNTMVK